VPSGECGITYVGAWLDPMTMASAVAWMVKISHVNPQFPSVPEGVDVYVRSGSHKMIYILVNFEKDLKTIELPHVMYDVLEKLSVRSLTLKHYDVRVLEDDSNE
jgi:beta-galactosidase GanA